MKLLVGIGRVEGIHGFSCICTIGTNEYAWRGSLKVNTFRRSSTASCDGVVRIVIWPRIFRRGNSVVEDFTLVIGDPTSIEKSVGITGSGFIKTGKRKRETK
jgi:hypothetical protein